jgi:hypothetical protein
MEQTITAGTSLSFGQRIIKGRWIGKIFLALSLFSPLSGSAQAIQSPQLFVTSGQWSPARLCLCSNRPGLYDGIWYRQIDQFRPWRRLHGGRICQFLRHQPLPASHLASDLISRNPTDLKPVDWDDYRHIIDDGDLRSYGCHN